MRRIAVALRAELARQAQELLPHQVPGGRASLGRWLAQLLRAELRRRKEARDQAAEALVRQYADVWMAFAARTFARLRGAVEIEELQVWAYLEARKAAHRFDPRKGYSFASLLKTWLAQAMRGYWRDQSLPEGVSLAYLDGDSDGEDGSRWERVGEVDQALESAPDRAAVRAAVRTWLAGLPTDQRRVARLLMRGLDGDELAERAGVELDQVELLRAGLAQALAAQGLGMQQDEELSPTEAAHHTGVPLKIIYKRLASGALAGTKREGAWVLRAADVRALARELES